MTRTSARQTIIVATLAVATVLTIAGCSADTATGGASSVAPISPAASSAGQPAVPTQPSSGTSASTPSGAPTSPGTAAAAATTAGSYIDYADYESDPGKYAGNEVVLFFNASWCPTCQEATGNLESNAIPSGLTVVSVDYDEATELKQKYGVTVQHTFVQVSPDGSELAKWSGSTTASEIQSKVV